MGCFSVTRLQDTGLLCFLDHISMYIYIYIYAAPTGYMWVLQLNITIIFALEHFFLIILKYVSS